LQSSFLGSSRAAAIPSLQDFSYYGDERQMKALRLIQQGGGMLADDGNRILNLLQEIGKRLPKKSDGGFAGLCSCEGSGVSGT